MHTDHHAQSATERFRQVRACRVCPRARTPAVSSSCPPAAPRAPPAGGAAGHQYFGRHRFSRDDGRPRQDAAPARPRRHPRAPIAARRSRRGRASRITLIDLVVVNLYPFVKAAQNPDTPFEELIEEIDIGGPSLVRAAAKNFADVLVVVSPADYPPVLEHSIGPAGRRRSSASSWPARRSRTRQLRRGDRVHAERGHGRRSRLHPSSRRRFPDS